MSWSGPAAALLNDTHLGLAKETNSALDDVVIDELLWERNGLFPWQSFSQLGANGLTGLTLPQEFGGRGLDRLSAVVAHEQVAQRSLTLGEGVQIALNGPSYALSRLGQPELARRLLPDVVAGRSLISIAITEEQAGSDLGAVQTTFTRTASGVRVNGTKCFVTAGALADSAMVLGRWEGSGLTGLGYVVVEQSTPGFEIKQTWQKMGGNAIPEVVLSFNQCEVPHHNVVIGELPGIDGFKQAMSSYNAMRLGIAAMCVGAATGILKHIRRHLRSRQQFGRPLGELQGLQWRVARLATRLDQARLMTYAVAAQTDPDGFPNAVGAAQAKLVASEVAIEFADAAIQFDGWRGIVSEQEQPSELIYRQLRGWSIAGGTSESLLNTIGSSLLRDRG